MIYTTIGFDEQQVTKCTLLVGVGETTHQLIVVDEQRVRFAASYDPARAEPEVTALFDLDFGTVKLAVADSRYTFVPTDVYDEEQHQTYLHYLPFDGVGTIGIADMAPLGIKLIHQTNRMGLENLLAQFPSAGSHPQVQGLLCAVAAQAMLQNGPLLVIERCAQWMTVGLFNAGNFLYCHDFKISSEDDLTYYLLSVMNQFGFAERKPDILLAGDFAIGDPYYERVEMYGGAVALADSGALTSIAVPDELVPYQHRFLSLLGLHRCV